MNSTYAGSKAHKKKKQKFHKLRNRGIENNKSYQKVKHEIRFLAAFKSYQESLFRFKHCLLDNPTDQGV